MNQSPSSSSSSLPEQLKMQLASLETALLERSPALPNILQNIHAALKAQPENVTLISEEDIGKIVTGLTLHTQVSFATSAAKGKSGSKAALGAIKTNAADALGF